MLPAQDPPCGSLFPLAAMARRSTHAANCAQVSIFAAIVLAGILSPPFACAQDLPARVHGITIPAIPERRFLRLPSSNRNRTGPTDGPRSTEPSTSLPVTQGPHHNESRQLMPSHFMARPNSRALRSSIRPLACASFTSPNPHCAPNLRSDCRSEARFSQSQRAGRRSRHFDHERPAAKGNPPHLVAFKEGERNSPANRHYG